MYVHMFLYVFAVHDSIVVFHYKLETEWWLKILPTENINNILKNG